MSQSLPAYPPLPPADFTMALFEEYDGFSTETLLAFADATFELRIARGAGALPPMPAVTGLARLRGDLVRKADADARCTFLARSHMPTTTGDPR